MSKKEEKDRSFDLSLDECKAILSSIEGLVVIDKDGKVRYLAEDMAARITSIDSSTMDPKYIGKPIEDVHPTSKIKRALQTGKTEKSVFYVVGGVTNVATIKPLIKDNKIVGAVDYDLFRNSDDIYDFLQKLNNLISQGLIKPPEESINQQEIVLNYKGQKYGMSHIIGSSPKILSMKRRIYDIAETNSTVLITGETGSGKELVAHAIHNISSRKIEPFIEINCAAIPESLFESELFGYESGTFTGATKGGKSGKFELADKGTILLDEIDQLPYHIQPKLLRVLQEREIDKIGSESIPVDVRVIATTNKDLRKLISENKFREDLFYRLNVVNIYVPPLCERIEDIPDLVTSFIIQLNDRLNREVEGVAPEVMDLFKQYRWPGNVRELYNTIESAMTNCREDRLEEHHFEEFFVELLKDETYQIEKGDINPLEEIRNYAEKKAIERALILNGHNKSKTAAFLKISRPNLYYRMSKFGIE